jgi:Sulfotransferase family
VQLQNFIQVPNRSALFAYVPKIACTNWKAVFRYMAGAADYLDAGKAHDRARSGLVHLDQLPAERAQALLVDPAVARYTFVRNPYTRALSAYLNKFRRYAELGEAAMPGDYFHTVYQELDGWRARNLPAEPRVTFHVFLVWLKESGHPMARNEHWLPQHEIVAPSNVRYDMVGRFENLAADAAELLRRLGVDLAFPTQEAVRFPSSGTAHARDRYLDAQARSIIEQLYRPDFDLLGYRIGQVD